MAIISQSFLQRKGLRKQKEENLSKELNKEDSRVEIIIYLIRIKMKIFSRETSKNINSYITWG